MATASICFAAASGPHLEQNPPVCGGAKTLTVYPATSLENAQGV